MPNRCFQLFFSFTQAPQNTAETGIIGFFYPEADGTRSFWACNYLNILQPITALPPVQSVLRLKQVFASKLTLKRYDVLAI